MATNNPRLHKALITDASQFRAWLVEVEPNKPELLDELLNKAQIADAGYAIKGGLKKNYAQALHSVVLFSEEVKTFHGKEIKHFYARDGGDWYYYKAGAASIRPLRS